MNGKEIEAIAKSLITVIRHATNKSSNYGWIGSTHPDNLACKTNANFSLTSFEYLHIRCNHRPPLS